jgi:hypothetical protein
MTELELESADLIKKLKLENDELKERLKKYTNPDRNKKYYQTHKDELKERDYKKSEYKPTKEQKKEYNKKYYENKKLEIK